MTSWTRQPVTAFDIESTGTDVFEDRIVTAAFVEVPVKGRPLERSWLINPGIDIPAEATAVHGITTRNARDNGQAPEDALFMISAHVALALRKGYVVAFNAAFDFSMLEAENKRHGLPTLQERLGLAEVQPVFDPYVIDKQYVRRKGKRILSAVCEHHNVPHAGAHSAAGDAIAAARLARVMVRKWPELGTREPRSVHRAQRSWYRAQQESLQIHLRESGKDPEAVCHTDWPVRSTP